jgi:hypothetical protein
MATNNYIGRRLFISAAAPTTYDATGYEALTWTEIKGLVSGPQFGFTHDTINIPDLTSGLRDAVKGMAQGQDTQFACRDTNDSDPGQAIVFAQAVDNDGNVSLKLARGSGTDNALSPGDKVEYCWGFLHSYLENQATEDSYEGFVVSFRARVRKINATEPTP